MSRERVQINVNGTPVNLRLPERILIDLCGMSAHGYAMLVLRGPGRAKVLTYHESDDAAAAVVRAVAAN